MSYTKNKYYCAKLENDTINTSTINYRGVVNELNVVTDSSQYESYNSSKTYSVNSYVEHNKCIYVCINAITTPKPWSDSDWELALTPVGYDVINPQTNDLIMCRGNFYLYKNDNWVLIQSSPKASTDIYFSGVYESTPRLTAQQFEITNTLIYVVNGYDYWVCENIDDEYSWVPCDKGIYYLTEQSLGDSNE